MEDRLDLMKVTVDPMHGVILADVFAEVQETLRHDFQSEFLQDFATHGITQCLSMILSATGENKELSFLSPDPHGEDIIAAQDDGASRRPDPRGITTGLTTWSGHEATLPRQAGQ
jgi:hypothetical protein